MTRRILHLPAKYRGRKLAFAVAQAKRCVDGVTSAPKKCTRCHGNTPQSRKGLCHACRAKLRHKKGPTKGPFFW